MVEKRKAMFSLEYVLLVGVVIAALLSMSIYLKRAICGRWRLVADDIGYGRLYNK